MFNEGKLAIFNTMVEPKTSGTKIFRASDKIVNIDELRKALNDDTKLVVIRNNVSKWSDATETQTFVNTDKLTPEIEETGEGEEIEIIQYDCTYTFSHWGRSLSGTTHRKIIMSFKGEGKNAILKATYFNS